MKNAFFYFLLCPFLGLIQGFKHYKSSWAKNSIWLFVVFYGYTMYKPDIMDSSRYVTQLEEMYSKPKSWDVFTSSLFTVDERGSGSVDIYQPTVSFMVSFITDNGNILFAVFGLVFGYFYSRNIWLLLDFSEEKAPTLSFWLLLFSFMAIIGFWNLGGVRMWTAAHVFFYGAFTFLIKGKKNGLLIALSSSLVHFSMLLPITVLLIYTVFNIPLLLLYLLFVGSFFVSTLNISVINSLIENNLPSFLVQRVLSYTDEDYGEVISDLNANANWYIIFYTKVLSWSLSILFTVIYFTEKRLKTLSKSKSKLFGFSMFILFVGNILSNVPSGGRYLMIAQLFGFSFLVLYYTSSNSVIYKKWLFLLSPVFVFYLIVSIRISLDTVTLMTLLSNPFLVSFINITTPIIDFIK